MPKLVSVSWRDAPGIPGLRSSMVQTIMPGKMQDYWAGWKVLIRGPAILLVSPPGWTPEGGSARKGRGRMVYELPRENAALRWEFSEDEEVRTPKDWTSPDETSEAVPNAGQPGYPHEDRSDGEPETIVPTRKRATP